MFEVLFKLKFFFKQHTKEYIFSFIAMIFSNFFSVLIPYIIGQMIDAIVTQEMTAEVLGRQVAFFTLSLILAYVFEYIWSYYLFTGSYLLQSEMRSSMMQHFLDMRAPFFEKFRTGDLMARSTQDIRSIADTAGYGMMVLMNATLFLSVLFVMMGATVSWTLTFFTLLPMSLLAYFFGKAGDEVDKRYTIAQEAFSKVNDDVLESIDGIRVLRAYVKEKDFVEKFQQQTTDLLKKNNRVADMNALFTPIVKIFVTISTLISLGYGSFLVADGVLSVGSMVAFQMYLGMIVWPIISIAELINVLRQGSASMRRVQQVLNANDSMEESGMIEADSAADIHMDEFQFQYSSSETISLQNIEVTIPKGKTLGIVGKTGSGKTTFIRQLLKQYPMGSGNFQMGSRQFGEYTDDSIRHMIGYVPQDHILFSRSVRENIAFGKKDATDEEIIQSIRIASFEEDLQKMEKGLDTMIGEKGVSISGGQKQRISIARALIKDPDILILDDSLSAVDAKTEQTIIENIEEIRNNKTTIISTHRLSAVKQADEIIVIENGKIIERGTHESLIDQKGWYYEQFLRQELKEGEGA